MHLIILHRLAKQVSLAFCNRDEAHGWQPNNQETTLTVPVSNVHWLFHHGESLPLPRPQFSHQKLKKHHSWLLACIMWDTEKSMNIHLGYTIASCSFLCWMDGWISLFWTRWKYFWNAPHHKFLFLVLFCWFFILFFFSINSPASCLYSCKLLAATILFQVSILNEEIVYTLPGKFSGCS